MVVPSTIRTAYVVIVAYDRMAIGIAASIVERHDCAHDWASAGRRLQPAATASTAVPAAWQRGVVPGPAGDFAAAANRTRGADVGVTILFFSSFGADYRLSWMPKMPAAGTLELAPRMSLLKKVDRDEGTAVRLPVASCRCA